MDIQHSVTVVPTSPAPSSGVAFCLGRATVNIQNVNSGQTPLGLPPSFWEHARWIVLEMADSSDNHTTRVSAPVVEKSGSQDGLAHWHDNRYLRIDYVDLSTGDVNVSSHNGELDVISVEAWTIA